jgi:hypothetical protein
MTEIFKPEIAARIAGLELNALSLAQVLPEEVFTGARIASAVTPIHDLNGEVLFYRVSVVKGKQPVAYADIAAHSAFSEPLLALGIGAWKAETHLKDAEKEGKKRKARFNQTRFVAYSYPKIAVQFLLDGVEQQMLELGSWQPVPAAGAKSTPGSPGNFERWSLIEQTPPAAIKKNLPGLQQRLRDWDDLCPPQRPPRGFNPGLIDHTKFKPILPPKFPWTIEARELHYSTNDDDHHPCYELRGQQTNVWCVGASTQMVLDFYRYNYLQTRVASELGLGTIQNPNGLPWARRGDVVKVLEKLTGNALDASMNEGPTWNEFRDEIKANRPLISFIPGHSRTVAGYLNFKFMTFSFRGLLVYDPWPPNQGVITRYENYNTQTYRVTFTAHVTLV